MDDSQTHSKPLPQGQFSSSLLSFSLCLEFVQLQPRSLLLCIAITLLQLHIAKLECPFMCSEGKLCSALLWVSKEPSLGWCCALSSAATPTLSAQESGHQASAPIASLSLCGCYTSCSLWSPLMLVSSLVICFVISGKAAGSSYLLVLDVKQLLASKM